MKVIHGRDGMPTQRAPAESFSGTVLADFVMPATDGVTINNVSFAPGARTFWHAHGTGQVLIVLAGRGWVCKDGESPQEIRAGDYVWIAANERHWHGAAEDSYMVHTAISIGKTQWQDEVIAPHPAP